MIDSIRHPQQQITERRKQYRLAQDSGCTALHHAVRRGDVDVVNILLKHGANPFIKDNLGKTAADYSDAFPELKLLLFAPFQT